MGLATQSPQLNPATVCEQVCRQESKQQKTPKQQKTYTHTLVSNRFLGKLSHIAAFPVAPLRHLGRRPCISAEIPHATPHSTHKYHKDGPSSASQDSPNGHDPCWSSSRSDDAPNDRVEHVSSSSSPLAVAACAKGVQIWHPGPYARDNGVQNVQKGGPSAHETSRLPSDYVFLGGQYECTSVTPSNVAEDINEDMLGAHEVLPSSKPFQEANLYSDDSQEDAKGHGICATGALQDLNGSRNSSNRGEAEAEGKIRRFLLTDPGLLKTLQEARALTPLEQDNLELIMKFKLMNDNLKGRLVIRALRTEQLSDLENLLTDSYSELMWGPLTYRPVLTWILSTYLRERQGCLPHAVTLVGLYAPSDDSNDHEVESHKWWLAGAVEISFNVAGKPKDMQTPMPPEDAPFLSNMAVLKRFRRRGIGRELLKAAEQLAVQMGGSEIYLHCRMIDEAPLNMYTNAGYSVVETNSILSLLLFQHRRHLMSKTLAAPLHQGIMVPED